MTPPPLYHHEGIELYQGDAAELVDIWSAGDTLVVDPPWNRPDLLHLAASHAPNFGAVLVFTDGRRMGETVELFGPPWWLFTWDTRNTWTTGPSSPVQQTKHCLAYTTGRRYDRDAALWGDAPPVRDHPTTKQAPLDGRRLTDLWSESIRWLHNPTAGRPSGGRGADRHHAVAQHAKPLGWIRCLIGNVTPAGGLVADPYTGTGTTLRAAVDLGLRAVGVELDAELCAATVDRLGQGVLAL